MARHFNVSLTGNENELMTRTQRILNVFGIVLCSFFLEDVADYTTDILITPCIDIYFHLASTLGLWQMTFIILHTIINGLNFDGFTASQSK